ncbi:MAG: FHA domain-containing protein [Armatimonadetes bacterium]|nr:FHA domain-containing protein [Armatimonadota bacterium]MDW8121038.1 FHA domain-containing protein [Armatimonadota bacterium]
MRGRRWLLGAGLALVFSAVPLAPQKEVTPVAEILAGKHTNQTVTVQGRSGYIIREETTATTTVFTLRDDYGDEIRVRTSKPEGLQMGVTYRVQGTVVSSGDRFYLIEMDRVNLGTPPALGPPPPAPAAPWWQENWLLLAIGGSAILLAFLILAYFVARTRREAREELEALRRREEALRRQLEESRKAAEEAAPLAPAPVAPPLPALPFTERQTDMAGPDIFFPPRKLTDEMWGTLEILSGPDQGKRFPIGGRRIVLGRTEGDIRFPNDSTVSANHAEIVATADGRILFVDHSRNGSKVNNQVVHYSQVEIHPGDTIEIGLTALRFMGKAPAPVAPPAVPATESVPLPQQPTQLGIPAAQDLPHAPTGLFLGAELEVIKGPDKGKRFPLVKTVTTIGRMEDRDIQLTDITVSRRHAVLELRAGKFYLRNESSQGTRVNSEMVQLEKELEGGEDIEMGGTVLKFLTTQTQTDATR